MDMASPVFHSSLSAAHLVSSSHPQNFRSQLEHLAGTNSLDIHQGRSEKHVNISYRHTYIRAVIKH